MIQNIQHPRKDCVPLAVGLGWGNDGAIYQEKLDGQFSTALPAAGGLLAVELMPGGEIIAWDCLEFEGVDVRGRGTETRTMMRDSLCRAAGVRVVQSHYAGGALLQAVLARGGEGIVRKLPGATYFDTMTAAKRLETWLCTVTAHCGGSQSVTIADAATGHPRGAVALRGGKCDRVRVGSILKIEGFSLTPAGNIREPSPCKDTPTSWLIKF